MGMAEDGQGGQVRENPTVGRRRFLKMAFGGALSAVVGGTAQAEGTSPTPQPDKAPEKVADAVIDIVVAANATEADIQRSIIKRLLIEPRANITPLSSERIEFINKGYWGFYRTTVS
jgi:hypothetical protein